MYVGESESIREDLFVVLAVRIIVHAGTRTRSERYSVASKGDYVEVRCYCRDLILHCFKTIHSGYLGPIHLYASHSALE
jgi:hypothetical protein